MYRDRRILAVVPARGGSKGVPLKNLRPVLGVPLVARVGECVSQVEDIDRAVVSTDQEEIARVGEAGGLKAPFRRPPALSGDRIGDWEVLQHALLTMEELDGCQYDVVVMLQPTSPLRRPLDVQNTLRKLVDEGFDAVWTVSPTDLKYHPLKQLKLVNGCLDYFDFRGSAIIARQQLEPVYHRNGLAYAFTRACLLDQKTIKGANSGAVIVETPCVSIDTLEDFDLVERLLLARPAAVS